MPLRYRGKLYNVAAALNHGRIVGFVPKTHIPNYNEFYEQRQFAGAEEEDVEFVDFLKNDKILFRCSKLFRRFEITILIHQARNKLRICQRLPSTNVGMHPKSQRTIFD